jgi:hypothetical protein
MTCYSRIPRKTTLMIGKATKRDSAGEYSSFECLESCMENSLTSDDDFTDHLLAQKFVREGIKGLLLAKLLPISVSRVGGT